MVNGIGIYKTLSNPRDQRSRSQRSSILHMYHWFFTFWPLSEYLNLQPLIQWRLGKLWWMVLVHIKCYLTVGTKGQRSRSQRLPTLHMYHWFFTFWPLSEYLSLQPLIQWRLGKLWWMVLVHIKCYLTQGPKVKGRGHMGHKYYTWNID